MTALLSRLAWLVVPEAATVAALLFALALVTEPLWQPLLSLLLGGGR